MKNLSVIHPLAADMPAAGYGKNKKTSGIFKK
jgi:hypothetical protein